MIVRDEAEQQEGMRKLCGTLGIERVTDMSGLPYTPRRGGPRTKEEYWCGDARTVRQRIAQRAKGARVQMEWETGDGIAVIRKTARREARQMMRAEHESVGGSHEGRTWDEREVLPKKRGCCVLAARATGQDGGRAATHMHDEEAPRGQAAAHDEEERTDEMWEADEWEADAEGMEEEGGTHATEWEPDGDEERYEDEMEMGLDGSSGRPREKHAGTHAHGAYGEDRRGEEYWRRRTEELEREMATHEGQPAERRAHGARGD